MKVPIPIMIAILLVATSTFARGRGRVSIRLQSGASGLTCNINGMALSIDRTVLLLKQVSEGFPNQPVIFVVGAKDELPVAPVIALLKRIGNETAFHNVLLAVGDADAPENRVEVRLEDGLLIDLDGPSTVEPWALSDSAREYFEQKMRPGIKKEVTAELTSRILLRETWRVAAIVAGIAAAIGYFLSRLVQVLARRRQERIG